MSSRHILFFVHGMGEHDNTWHEKGLAQLKSSFLDYEFLKALDFDDQFEAVPLVYNDIFKDTRDRANADFAGFKSAVLGQVMADQTTKDAVESQIDKYADLIGAGGDSFVWTHILDVILYRFAHTIREGVDVRVARQLTDKLSTTSHVTWSVIAHSLGTSVAHNVINSLYNTGFPNAEDGPIAPLDPLESRCTTLAMIANVSRVLQRSGAKVLETAVKPGSASSGRLCSFYLNCRHKLDPFTIPKPFEPDLWPDATTFSSWRYQHIRPMHIHFESEQIPRVHDLDHYVSNPRVHVPIFRTIMGKPLIPDAEFEAAKAQFDAENQSDVIDKARDKARAALESRLPASTGNWRNLLAAIKRLLS